MSNERSPRDVCSITIGINGLMSGWLLAAGGPQFRLCRRFFLVRGPDPLARLGLLGGDTLDVRDDAVEGSGQADVLALGLVHACLARLLDHLLGLVESVAKRRVDLLVGDLNPELVCYRLEYELPGDRGCGLLAQARHEILRRVARELQIRLQGAAAATHDGVE